MAEQPSTGAPLWPGPMDVSARLDRIEKRLADLEGLRPAVESALVAQAARIETMLAAARRDLGEVATMDDHVRTVVTGLSAEADDRQDAVLAAVRATTGPVETLAAAVEALHRAVTQAREEAAADRRGLQQVRERLDAVVADHATEREQAAQEAVAAREQHRDAVAAGVDEVRRAGEQAVAAVGAHLSAAVERMEQLTTGVASLEDALAGHLDALDQRQVVERARLTQAFAEQLADGLSRRERRRLSRRLDVPAPAPAPTDPVPTASPGGNGAPAAGPAAGSPPPVVPVVPAPASTAPRPVTVATSADEAEQQLLVAEDVPAREGSAAAEPATEPEPARVRPSRRDRPVRRTASDPGDPAAVRRALAAVRGLGPARQSALIDRFGTLEAIREAPDEELLAIRGIGPALLPAIRDAVG